jgi:3D (Asp-Asp-Asp) domain-containing protein
VSRTIRWVLFVALLVGIAVPTAQAHMIPPPKPVSKMTLVQRRAYQLRVLRHDRAVLKATAWITKLRIQPGIVAMVFRAPVTYREFHQLQFQWTTRELHETEAAIRAKRSRAHAAAGRHLTVWSTCYDLRGHTRSGTPVGWGTVATDPSVIPLGSRLYVPGYGPGRALDTGGAIKGAGIDVWMPTGSQCAAWGRRTVTITVY